MLTPRQKLQEQWKNRHRAMQMETPETRGKKPHTETTFPKNKEQTHPTTCKDAPRDAGRNGTQQGKPKTTS